MDAEEVVRQIRKAIKELGTAAKKVDAIGLAVMSPAWVAMDVQAKP